MRYLRPFELAGAAGTTSDWLIAPAEELGCSVRLRRGGGQEAGQTVANHERVAVVFAGEATLAHGSAETRAGVGDTIFMPAGQPAAVNGTAGSAWIEIEAHQEVSGYDDVKLSKPVVNPSDQSLYENYKNSGFWMLFMVERAQGSQTIRLNSCQVENGCGSPDWHIHPFAQMYIVQEGTMTVEIGCHRYMAGPNTVVVLPAGVVHRNFNNSGQTEKHLALLVPEPDKDAIFDYAVTIHDEEAEMLTVLPD